MHRNWLYLFAGAWLAVLPPGGLRAEVIVAEGEFFQPRDAKGWKVTHQQDSYASHTYGGMWMTHGGCLGAPADCADSLATQTIPVKEPGKFRVWSKYQAPPYFNYLHRIEIVQNGRTLFSHVYGKKGTDRLWSFSGVSDELWWPWGVDHDCAEAPRQLAELAAGSAEVRLIAVANAKPAGDRFVDFVLLTTNPADDYEGFKPYRVGTPFANEALAATRLYLRFFNASGAVAQLAISRAGHFQPNYGGASTQMPAEPVPAGQWSEWFNIGSFCRLVHDEGLTLNLAGAAGEFGVQLARDPAGKDRIADLKLHSGEAVVLPIDVTWNRQAQVKTSRQHAEEIIAQSKKWRKANGGRKPREVLFYGAFAGQEDWVSRLKDALGYNTLLPDSFEHVRRDGLHAHAGSAAAIRALADKLADKERLRVLSFGDEISLGSINFKDPTLQEKFRAWLKARGLGRADLGVEPAEAVLTRDGSPRLVWYSNLFNEEERFAAFRDLTQLARERIGPHVLTGANYSPHHLALYYGPVYQWVDIFKHQGMSLIWAEDYIFSVPEVPQIISWQFAQMRCGAKYHQTPIHFYVMPHAPGQEPGFLRRNLLLSVGYGAHHIDNFWIALAERYTENYVSWNYRDTFRVLHEAIFDTAEAEKLQAGGTLRPARVAVVTGKATDFNESRTLIDKARDPFARQCRNAPTSLNQIICRKEQQMLYLALVQAGHMVDTITEDDIVAGALKAYEVVYFAGEWIDERVVPRLEEWVKSGGVLYASGGIGHLNQFGEPEPAMRRLLGLKDSRLDKHLVILRTLLELPLLEPCDSISLGGDQVPAIGLRQVLVPETARVLGTFADGSAAVTVHELGRGKAFAVGTLAGAAWMKTALRPIPFARGGRHTVYNPTDFDPSATRLVRLGLDARAPEPAAVCSQPGVEAIVLDHKDGTLVTLVNWTNGPLKDLKVSVRLARQPATARSVSGQKDLHLEYANGRATFQLDLAEADYVLLLH
jgi:hypothetical protein